MNSWIAQDVLSIVVLYLPQWKSFIGCCDLPPGFILACACVFIIFSITSCFKMCKLCHYGLKTDVVMAVGGAAVKSITLVFHVTQISWQSLGYELLKVFRDHIGLALLNGLIQLMVCS